MARWIGVMGIAAAIVAVGSAHTVAAQDSATAPPPFQGRRVETVPRAELLAYARQLSFDARVGAGDAQHLRWRERGSMVNGPLARIAPEQGAYLLAHEQLASGRIIARMWTGGPVRPLGLPGGDVFLWADSTPPRGWRWVVIPVNPAERLRVWPLRLETHPQTGRWLPGGARLLIGVAAGLVWSPCQQFGCCCIDPSGGGNCEPMPWPPGGAPGAPLGSIIPDTRWPRVDTLPPQP